ncbi:hypothetical protein INR49_020666 [Caranx melampygus]|nr:hypothetical protein INR49_020666 [Caranx melampygus]
MKSEEDDTRSVTASSVMSLFHRLQMDPLEKAWLRSCAEGNMAAQRQLLTQDPGLVLKKVVVAGGGGVTALHWAAKQGRQDAVDMMLRSGADVNIRSGPFTPLSDESCSVNYTLVLLIDADFKQPLCRLQVGLTGRRRLFFSTVTAAWDDGLPVLWDSTLTASHCLDLVLDLDLDLELVLGLGLALDLVLDL